MEQAAGLATAAATTRQQWEPGSAELSSPRTSEGAGLQVAVLGKRGAMTGGLGSVESMN